MKARRIKIVLFALAGVATGVIFAGFGTRDYLHAMAVIKKGMDAKPIHISEHKGKQVIALSLRNLQHSRNIEIRMKDAVIQSWYPPVVRMPFGRRMEVEGGLFRGVDFGARLPLYLVVDGNIHCGAIEIIDADRGTAIQTVQVKRGGGHGGTH